MLLMITERKIQKNTNEKEKSNDNGIGNKPLGSHFKPNL